MPRQRKTQQMPPDRFITPRLNFSDQQQLQLQEQGLDVKIVRIRILEEFDNNNSDYVFEVNGENTTTLCAKYFQPLKKFVQCKQYVDYLSQVYNEFRIVKCAMDISLASTWLCCHDSESFQPCIPGGSMTDELGAHLPVFIGGWIRQSVYGNPPEFPTEAMTRTILQLPDAQMKVVGYAPIFNFKSQIVVAGEEESNWMQTKVTPGDPPNMEFFCPCFCTCVQFPYDDGASHVRNRLRFYIVHDLIVECRGTKYNSTY